MSYADFTLDRAKQSLGLELREWDDLFGNVPEREADSWFRRLLAENVPIALGNGTEKARSEMIVSQVLVEVRRLLDHRVSLFSGIEFNVDPIQGLNGVCDFLISKSPSQWMLVAPVLVVVEAKNENIKAGLGQCVAEMVAASLFNEAKGDLKRAIFGSVTTGTAWQFLKLDGKALDLDRREYHLEHIDKILGILASMLEDEGDKGRLVA